MSLRRTASVLAVAVAAVIGAGAGVGGDPTLRAATTPTTVPWTLPPTDPVDPTAEVAAAAVETWDVRMNAYINLDAPGNEAALNAHYTPDGEARAVIESDLQALRDEGWRVRDNPEAPTRFTVESVALLDGPPSTRADVQVCVVDSGIVYEPAGAQGVETLVNDDITTGRSIQHFRHSNGHWLLDDVEDVAEWPGPGECPSG